MTIACLHHISALLSFEAAVHEKGINLHLKAERDRLKHIFGFDYPNY